MRQVDLDPGDTPEGVEQEELPEDDAWVQGRAIMDTVTDIELIDPDLSSEVLLYRLFHEPGVRVFDALPVKAQCTCSREAVEAMLKTFSQDDRDHMVKDGKISKSSANSAARNIISSRKMSARTITRRKLRRSRATNNYRRPCPRRRASRKSVIYFCRDSRFRGDERNRAQLTVRRVSGPSSENGGISMSKRSPLGVSMP